ncbi:unnamed protein product [Arctogadus glacialis]
MLGTLGPAQEPGGELALRGKVGSRGSGAMLRSPLRSRWGGCGREPAQGQGGEPALRGPLQSQLPRPREVEEEVLWSLTGGCLTLLKVASEEENIQTLALLNEASENFNPATSVSSTLVK